MAESTQPENPSPFLTDKEKIELAGFLQALLQTPSPSSFEREVATLLQIKCHDIGFDDVEIDEAGNVIATKHYGSGPVLLFDAHMDTANILDSISPEEPFPTSFDGQEICGLGACEGKSAIASILTGLGKFLNEGQFEGTLIAVFLVLGNYCEGSTLKYVLETRDITPDAIILGEPSDLKIIRGHRGRILFNLKIHGKSCHSATPHLGKNAIVGAGRLLFSIDMLSTDLLHDPFLGPGTISVTEINSEAPSRNALPHTANLFIDRRLTVGESGSRARAELENIIIRENLDVDIEVANFEAKSYTGFPLEREGTFNAWSIDENNYLVSETLKILSEISPENAQTIASTFSTDGAYSVVERDIPTIGFGPGDVALSHTGSECVTLDDLITASEVYFRICKHFLTDLKS